MDKTVEHVGRAIMRARHKTCCRTRDPDSFPFDPAEAVAAIQAVRDVLAVDLSDDSVALELLDAAVATL